MEKIKSIFLLAFPILFSSCFCKKIDLNCIEYELIEHIIESKYQPDSVLIEIQNNFVWDLHPPCGFRGVKIFIDNGTTNVIDFKDHNFPSYFIRENYSYIQGELRKGAEKLMQKFESFLEDCNLDFVSISFVMGPEIYLESYNFQTIFWAEGIDENESLSTE